MVEDCVAGLARWFHFIFGIMWIGLLYYFNFVQVASLKEANADGTAAGDHQIRAAARAVVLPLGGRSRRGSWARSCSARWADGTGFVKAFTFQAPFTGIGIGAWLGTIMLINVWTFIWQNQKKVIGITPATDEEKNKARRIAFLASRTNTMLSIPMLFFMAAGFTHKSMFGL